MKIANISGSLQPLFAPAAYALGRVLRSDAIVDFSRRLDPMFVRAHLHKIGKRGGGLLEAQRFSRATQLLASMNYDCSELIRDSWSNSRSQLLQDLFAIATIGAKRNGYFLEIGVGDGEHLSNTYLLEKQYGWSGILIEPNPKFHSSIQAKRSAILDRRAAFSSSGRQLAFLMDSEVGELSTLVDFDGRDAHRRAGDTTIVETATLDEILLEHGAPQEIDYVSIDTEGSEYEVLKALDLDRWKVSVFSIESNYDADKSRMIESILFAHRYERVLPQLSCFDNWYVHEEVRQRIC